MGRGTSGASTAPASTVQEARRTSDQKLVARVRRGDDRAFELLYERYHRRIHAYVLGMVKDHGRAEDVTQEVFVSALRRMRETEQPLAFKPWLYQIAKNSCIDAFRRSKRTEEVSYDADDALAPADHSQLVGSGAVARRRRRGQAGARQPLRRVRRPVGDPPRDPRPARARGPVATRRSAAAWA